ncbi:uncharacterized protein LOC115663442 [Syzygium oleosum]|uniref:uncharacterized protein LOC115663442 n=1 Tax=Syzygium oleosum TaxID=219896 RepID=UPI0011D22FAE|nr:uncharacterized protein LOC115663442 [Syzygium oleosum]
MSDQSPDPPPPPEPATRAVGGTEYSWCRAVPGGTGITVLALLLAKPPDLSLLRNALHDLQKSHPMLRSRIRFDPVANAFSFVIPSSPHLEITPFDLSSTSRILSGEDGDGADGAGTAPLHVILEHEMNRNAWRGSGDDDADADADVFHASLYHLSEDRWALALRLHTAACDRAAAAALLRKLLLAAAAEGRNGEELQEEEEEAYLGIEELVPSGKANKPFWARGMDLLGYSLNSFRLANLEFVEAEPPRCSRMVRLKMNRDDTQRLVAGCKSREIKLCGALAAAALIAAHASKQPADSKWEKYAVVTLVDCRSYLDPPLSVQQPGFYHSAILNTHDVCGSEKLWDLAKRTYTAFANAKSWNKHFTDMADLNFLMCKAIDNPGLTVSSSLRTAFVSVFEDTVVNESNPLHEEIGVGDYIGCASVHGVGPSIAFFDTIRDGELDCACVYPSPLHSREQMQKLIDDMKRILAEAD